MQLLQQEIDSLRRMADFDKEPEKTAICDVLKGVCSVCHTSNNLRKNGTVYKHGRRIDGTYCQGSGNEPAYMRRRMEPSKFRITRPLTTTVERTQELPLVLVMVAAGTTIRRLKRFLSNARQRNCCFEGHV